MSDDLDWDLARLRFFIDQALGLEPHAGRSDQDRADRARLLAREREIARQRGARVVRRANALLDALEGAPGLGGLIRRRGAELELALASFTFMEADPMVQITTTLVRRLGHLSQSMEAGVSYRSDEITLMTPGWTRSIRSAALRDACAAGCLAREEIPEEERVLVVINNGRVLSRYRYRIPAEMEPMWAGWRARFGLVS